LGFVILVTAACDRLPTSPSSAALQVHVVDDSTGSPITDSVYRLELQLTAHNRMYTQPVVNGIAEFSDVVPADYRLTTNALFGYVQLDFLTVTVEGARSMTLRLAPIDDLGIERISVDGQADVQPNGTIAIPLRGVTLRLRGKYQSPRSPWPAENEFGAAVVSATPGIEGVGHEGGTTTSGPLSANDFEIAIPNWTPCTRLVDGRLSDCFSNSEILLLTMSTPLVGGSGGARLIQKSQTWPLKYDLAPGCCLP
jgi:hypothetical protein